MYNVIDIGTSSIKSSTYQYTQNKYSEIVFRSKDFRLIDQITNRISNNSQQSAINILQDLLSLKEKYNIKKTICISTHALRSAENASSFIKTVKQGLNLSITIITGEQEAYFIADSIKATELLGTFFSFDIGGGSIEFNLFDHSLKYSASKNIGTISILNFLKKNNQQNTFKNIQKFILSRINEIQQSYDLKQYPLVCTGGSLIIAREILQKDNILFYDDIKKLYQKVYNLNYAERIQTGIPVGKADIFDIALAITLILMELTMQQHIIISRANVRHGIVLNQKIFQ